MLLTPQQQQQFNNDPRYGSSTEKYLALLENTHITCRGFTNTNNDISNNNNNNNNNQSNDNNTTLKNNNNNNNNNNTIKNSTNNKNNRNNNNKNNRSKKLYSNGKLLVAAATSSSSSSSSDSSDSSEEYSETDEDEETEEIQEEELSDGEYYCQLQQKYIKEQEEQEQIQKQQDDDDSSDFSNEEEDYSLTSSEEEEEILSDDESTDKSSSESSEEESDSEELSDLESDAADESAEEELQKRKEWMNVNSNLSLKKSVSSIFFKVSDCDSTSDDSSEEEEEDDDFDSSSGQEGSFSDKELFEDQFLQVPGSYSINISTPPKDKNRKIISGDYDECGVDDGILGAKPTITIGDGKTTGANDSLFSSAVVSSDDELYNNRYYDDSEEELNREIIKKEQENDKIVLIAIRKSINGINSGDGESKMQLPCWYGFEDESHIKVIFQHYSSFLSIDQEVKHTLRGPKPFIGRIHRRAIKYDAGGDKPGCNFTTLDTIKVYRWEIQPIGRPLNLYKSFVLLTRWDEENGLPVKLQKVNSLSNKEFWANEAKSLKSQSKISSYLYCSPVFDTDFTFNYSIDADKYPVDFLPNSPMMSGRRHHQIHQFDDNHQQNNNNNNNCQQPQKLNSLNRNNKLSDSQLLPNIKSSIGIVTQRRSSHPSLLLSSHIYSHSIIPQNGFKDKSSSNDYS